MKSRKIDVQNIPSQLFLLCVIDAIHTFESDTKDTKDAFNHKLCIDVLAEDKVYVFLLFSDEKYKGVSSLSFTNTGDSININSNFNMNNVAWDMIMKADELNNLYSRLTDLVVESVEIRIISNLKNIGYYQRIIDCYPYLFNKITCINNNTGIIEDISLSPYYNIINQNQLIAYNTIECHGKRSIVHNPEEHNNIASAYDVNELGNLYTLSSSCIQEFGLTQKTSWTPVCSIEKNTKVPFNKLVYLKDVDDNTSRSIHLYISTKGVLFEGNAMLAALGICESKTENDEVYKSIEYKSNYKTYVIYTLESGEVVIGCSEADGNMIYKKYIVEKVVVFDRFNADYNLLVDHVKMLKDEKIYDGTEFEPLISTNTKNKPIEDKETKNTNIGCWLVIFVVSVTLLILTSC